MTQGELEKIPDKIVKAMNDLEIRIMDDIVRRIKINGFSTAGADWQFDRLQQLGMSEKEIKDWVRQTLDVTDKEIDKIFSDEVYEQYMKHGRGYEAYGREQIPFDENIELQQLIEAVKRQANEELERITGSMGFVRQGASGKLTPIELSDFYTQTLDSAMYDIHSGAFDYNTVLKRTIEDMTKSGLRWIDYESGWHNRVPVAARRAVMTGFRQVQGKINEQTAEALGTDSYEVTVHIGARPTHQVWEGKIWTMTQLRTVCGLGTVTGLHGANCYHDYNPFIPGVDVPAYSQEELDQIHKQENTPKTYNGKEYTTYEALQRQRQLETRARKYREDVHLLELGGGSEEDIQAKKCRYQGTLQEYRDFSKKMDLPMQKERIYQDGLKVDMKAKKNVEKKTESGIIKPKEVFMKDADARKDFRFISDREFDKLTIRAKKKGAMILRGTEEVEKHLDEMEAAAANIGDVLLFRKNVTVSEVLEETHHFEQNLEGMNNDKVEPLRTILNEIDAKKYIIGNAKKYRIPRNEVDHIKRQLESYEKQLKDYLE